MNVQNIGIKSLMGNSMDYRGEIGVILINHGKEAVMFSDGDRVAQLVLNKVEQIQWEETRVLNSTHRGEGAFGSTGVGSTMVQEEVLERINPEEGD